MTETSFKIPHRWRDAPVYECVLPPEIAAQHFRVALCGRKEI